MRKAVAMATAATALVGSLGAFGTQAVAAPREAGVSATQVSAQAKCVTVVRWYSERSNRKVAVKNSCSRKACFSVTLDYRKDPKFAIGAKTKGSFRYAGTLWSKGTGIKNIGC